MPNPNHDERGRFASGPGGSSKISSKLKGSKAFSDARSKLAGSVKIPGASSSTNPKVQRAVKALKAANILGMRGAAAKIRSDIKSLLKK